MFFEGFWFLGCRISKTIEWTMWITSFSWWFYTRICSMECWFSERQTSDLDGCNSIFTRNVKHSLIILSLLSIENFDFLVKRVYLPVKLNSSIMIKIFHHYYQFLHVYIHRTARVTNNRSISIENSLNYPDKFVC